MKKLKFSMVSMSILLSFGLFAQEQGTTSLYDSAKQEIGGTKNSLKSSDERSQLRNQETLNQLRNSILDEDISTAEKQLKLKKLQFKLENVPPEYLDNFDAYLDKEYYNPKETQKYPTIASGVSVGRDSFPAETYAIDQQVLIPQLEALKKSKNKKITNVDMIQVQTDMLKPIIIPEPINEPDVIIKTPIVKNDSKSEQKNDFKDGFEELETILSAEELAKIRMSLSGKDEPIDTKSKTMGNIEEEVKDYSEIKSADILEVFIFGDDKSVDLKLNIYVGDGVEGENFSKILKNVKEDQVISVKDYSYKIDNISFTEVVIKNMKTNEIYIASKSLRNL